MPVAEATGLPYASTVTAKDKDGHTVPVMHACGHDMHVTWLIGATTLLAQAREHWHGTVMAVFQPAEETGTGAQKLATAWVSRGHMDRLVESASILPLINKEEVAATQEALGAMEIDQKHMTLQNNGVIWTLRIERPSLGNRADASDQRTLSAALEWTLAMVWLHQQMHEPLHFSSTPDTTTAEIGNQSANKTEMAERKLGSPG